MYPFTLLRVCGELGSGAFGVVMQADLFDPLTQTTSTVAVKMLKGLALEQKVNWLLTISSQT